MSKATCPHCQVDVEDWRLEHHECIWYVWEQGTDECFARERKGPDVRDIAERYAFFEGDAGRLLCDYPDCGLTLCVRRKNSDDVTIVRVTGHWQPTYQAFVNAPIKMPRKAVA
jgi:hypothetical protein